MRQPNIITPQKIPDRRIITEYPIAYNGRCSPYTDPKDFSKDIRLAIELQQPLRVRTCKVIFIGDVSVGKTTILNRFCYDKFQESYKATIGVDFEVENFQILGRHYSLEIWDTAGQERFKCIAQAYYRNANIIVVVFDMTKKSSLQATTTWLQSALTVNSMQKPLIFLVGSKSDLLTKEEFIEMENFAGEIAVGIRAEYWSVSARTGYKIVELFQRIAALSFESAMKQAVIELSLSKKYNRGIMQRGSAYFTFRKRLKCDGNACTKKGSSCLC